MIRGFVPSSCFVSPPPTPVTLLFVVSVDDYAAWAESAPAHLKGWLSATDFRARPGACSLLPGSYGSEAEPAGAVLTVSDAESPFEYAELPRRLPRGSYQVEPELPAAMANALCLGFALGSYQFLRYKKKGKALPQLVWPETAEQGRVLSLAEGICLTRDLINTPASDMGPEQLAQAAKGLAKTHDGKFRCVVGDALLKKNFPMIHAVGRASSSAPRLIDLSWGNPDAPKVTLVGKGVCFDTGGLDLKPAQYMKLMKKDMGGAGLVLGLAHAVMSQKLALRLRVLIPAVENSVAGNAMRPLDVLTSRHGMTVEVGDTDAEGRLVLADALCEADSDNPDLLFDAATLTGAARVALGTAMPAIFCHRLETWNELAQSSDSAWDPLWRLPLFRPYRKKLESKVADISNIGDNYGGAITAALFLSEFVSKARDWVHMDTMGYNLEHRPGRPVGGEALGLLALLSFLENRYPAPEEQGQTEPATSTPREQVTKKKTTKKTPRKKGSPASKQVASSGKKTSKPPKKATKKKGSKK